MTTRQDIIEDLEHKVRRAEASDPAGNLADTLAKNIAAGWQNPLFETLKWSAEKAIAAETVKNLWAQVVAHGEGDLIAGLLVVFKQTTRELAFGYPGDTYSGRVANDLIRCQNDAKQRWAADEEWTVNKINELVD